MESRGIESLHGRFGEGFLNEHWIFTLGDARETAEQAN